MIAITTSFQITSEVGGHDDLGRRGGQGGRRRAGVAQERPLARDDAALQDFPEQALDTEHRPLDNPHKV